MHNNSLIYNTIDRMKNFLCIAIIAMHVFHLHAQKLTPFDVAIQHIQQKTEQWQLDKSDVSDLAVSDNYVSKHNKVHHYYFAQRYNGVEIYNAISGVHLNAKNEVFFSTNAFVPNIQTRVQNISPSISPAAAVVKAAENLGYTVQPRQISSNREINHYLFEKESLSHVDIPVKLKYFLTNEGKLRLVWDVSIDETRGDDYWSMRVDAETGEILDKTSFTIKCTIHPGTYHRHNDDCVEEKGNALSLRNYMPKEDALAKNHAKTFGMNKATYNVFAYPVESPVHGDRSIVSDDFFEEASPFGWHDTNGQPGAEYTITRGNNVHAWPDRAGTGNSSGIEPDGGPALIFDFDFNGQLEPIGNLDLATVNLFYFNNIMHDFSYAYGFDEESGNFQFNNYGKGGLGNDAVDALAQFGGGQGEFVNNANFSTTADGGIGRMRMYLWNRRGQSLLTGVSPAEIAKKYETGFAQFGAEVTSNPVTGKLVRARDNTGSPFLACRPIVNGPEVAGNIALIDRGSCFFIEKALNAQAVGAIAVVICNFENATLTMGAGEGFDNPGIPVVMLSAGDCVVLKQLISDGVEVTVSLFNEDDGGPNQLDGTIDNGIVAHEYGHGISNRLTGGPAQAGCLNNEEQMGEGWSDFFSLITTIRPGDTGELGRGIGTYASGQTATGAGIRRFRYSTNFNINPQTYDDIINTPSPHGLGEVWVATIWDLFWALVDKYGFDEDMITGSGGNNMAIQLVMDGMKLQVCRPGLLDGRDAILAADRANYDGANQCLIWDVFARRGLGFDADQGLRTSKNDGVEGFKIHPTCLNKLLVEKKSTPFIVKGDVMDVEIEVGNYRGVPVTGVVVRDGIPDGASYVANSSSHPSTVSGDEIVFQLGNFDVNEVKTITYQVKTSSNRASSPVFFDDMESPTSDLNWEQNSFGGENFWEIYDELPYEGQKSWVVFATPSNHQAFKNFEPIRLTSGSAILRFFHDYDTQPLNDAGLVQLSVDGGSSWFDAGPYIIRNNYRGKVAFPTFAIPNARGFWGPGNGFKETLIDLGEFAGEEIFFQFRFGADAETITRVIGWSIDNIEVMNALFYNTEVCVTSVEGDSECTFAIEGGTLVEADLSTSTYQNEITGFECKVFPNPASTNLNVILRKMASDAQSGSFELYTLEGKMIRSMNQQLYGQDVNVQFPVNELPAGLYILKVRTGTETAVHKVQISR